MILLCAILISFNLYAQDIPFRVIHTNDLHSHFEGTLQQNANGEIEHLGSYPRLLHEISRFKQQAKDQNKMSLTLDAGDFYAGTIFHTLGPWDETEIFPEWEYFTRAGYDAVILGNHEFDPGNTGVRTMFNKVTGGPALVSTNVLIPESSNLLKNVLPYASKEISYEGNKIKVAILGILGPDGCLVSRGTREKVKFIGFDDENSKARWSDLINHLQNQIDTLKKDHQVIILVMHAGNPEDEKLAQSLEDIDLIIAGHTHKTYGEFVSGVPISQAGSFGKNLGVIDLSYNFSDDKVTVITPTNKWLHPIKADGGIDQDFKNRIKRFKELSQKRLGDNIPPLDKVIFTPKENLIHSRVTNNPLGTFITTNIQKEIVEKHNIPIDVYFTSMGLIRNSFYKGVPYSVADIFEFLSVGFDEEGRAGSKVSVFKLSPNHIETVIEFLELYSNFSNSFAPAFSDSVSFKIRKWGIPFINRIYDIKINDIPLNSFDKPLTVATNMFVARNVDLIKQKTYGIFDIQTLDLSGNKSPPSPAAIPKEFELFINSLMQD